LSGLIGENLKPQTKVKNNFRLNWAGKSFPAEPGKFGVNATPICASFAAMMDDFGVRNFRAYTMQKVAARPSARLAANGREHDFVY
jgi:hypothetical protein